MIEKIRIERRFLLDEEVANNLVSIDKVTIKQIEQNYMPPEDDDFEIHMITKETEMIANSYPKYLIRIIKSLGKNVSTDRFLETRISCNEEHYKEYIKLTKSKITFFRYMFKTNQYIDKYLDVVITSSKKLYLLTVVFEDINIAEAYKPNFEYIEDTSKDKNYNKKQLSIVK